MGNACTTIPSLGIHIVRPTVIMDMGPVVALLDGVEARLAGAWSRLDSLAPPLPAPT